MTEMLLLQQTLEEAAGSACFSCSFQAEDGVLLHMLQHVEMDIHGLFLESGYRIPALLRYRDAIAESWGIRLVNVSSDVSRDQQEHQFGLLYRADPTACCRMRKLEPLRRALENYSVWFTGLRREQSPTRAL